MRGLLLKDFALLKGQKQFFGIVFLITAMFMFTIDTIGFAIAYVMIMMSMFTISTISYDEYENGMAYMFTLPIDRKLYAVEKYVYSIAIMLMSGGAMLLFGFAMVRIRGLATEPEELIVTFVSGMFLVILMLSLMIPITFKFGMEKSRIVMMALFILLFVGSFGFAKLFKEEAAYYLSRFVKLLNGMQVELLTGGMLMVMAILLAVSSAVSVAVIKKKEF